MLLNFFALLSYSFILDYEKGVEGVGSYSISPVIFNLEGGEALGLIEIPDASIKVTIEGVLAKTFTKEDNIGLLTFRNNATVEVTFETIFSYFVSTVPYTQSSTGAVLYISNLNNSEFSFTNVNKDVYLSFVDEYTLKGDASCSSGDLTFRGTDMTDDKKEHFSESYGQKSFEYTPIMFGSSFVRKSSSSSLTINGKASCFESFTPDVPTIYTETWDKVDSRTRFAKDCAFGGIDLNVQIPLIEDAAFVSVYNKITIDSYLEVVFSYSSERFSRKVERNQKFVYGNEFQMTVEVYFNNELCTNELITSYMSPYSQELRKFTYFDIPDKCKPRYGLPTIPNEANQFLFFDLTDISDDKIVEFVISFDGGKRYVVPHQYIELGNIGKFTVTVYVTVPNLCNNVEYLKYDSTEEKVYFTLNDGMVLMCHQEKEGLSKGAIAGIVIACVVVVVAGVVVGIVIWKVRARKKKIGTLIESSK